MQYFSHQSHETNSLTDTCDSPHAPNRGAHSPDRTISPRISRKANSIKCHARGSSLKEKSNFVLRCTIPRRGMLCTTIALMTNDLPSDWLTKKKKHNYSGGSWSSGKQYLQFIHERQDEAGTGPGSPGPV